MGGKFLNVCNLIVKYTWNSFQVPKQNVWKTIWNLHYEKILISSFYTQAQNDLNKERSPELIAKSIVDLATTLKGNSRDVSASNIIVRGDNSNLNEKGCEVNAHLTEMCKERKLNLINYSKKIKDFQAIKI